MKNLMKSLRLTIAFCLVLSVCYVFVLWVFGRVFSPGKGNVELVTLNGQVVGAANVGQKFEKEVYFWGRPSAVDYQADASGASNKGVTNEEYLEMVEARTDSLLVRHPYLERDEIPAEMVTASASGLDPDITPESAYIQIRRVAHARGISEEQVRKIVDAHIERPLLGLFGVEKINVLKLNVALDEAEGK